MRQLCKSILIFLFIHNPISGCGRYPIMRPLRKKKNVIDRETVRNMYSVEIFLVSLFKCCNISIPISLNLIKFVQLFNISQKGFNDLVRIKNNW